ncbi:P-loop ATPase, Sll1717 family [Raineyella sp.]|uniref:Orc1-like AAA ATPase domain-containing protein n=1 Tax=bioreactor metagenome TaxID=1076179 RepID=A0A644XHZ7_9ZZZZ|nr:hypothetical protein [Raineyella sp.]MEA5153617.1 hypothetical protein [Raineyella sp.]
MNLQSVDFGRFDAESDSKLIDYFVETGSAASAGNGKQLVLGRKGSGKTALFVHLKASLDAKVVDLDLNEYLFSVHAALREAGVADSGSYVTAWKMLIYMALTGSLEPELKGGERRAFKSILNDLQVADKRGGFAQILGWLKRVKRVDLPELGGVASLGGLELEESKERFVGADFIAAVVKLEELAKTLVSRRPVTVLIDRIDDVWDGTPEAKDIIAGH